MESAEAYIKECVVRVEPGRFAIVKAGGGFEGAFAVVKDAKETTVIISENQLEKVDALQTEFGWRLITFDVVMPFEVVGFLAAVSGALAKENIPIFAVSAFSTDHIFVQDRDLSKTLGILRKLGCGF